MTWQPGELRGCSPYPCEPPFERRQTDDDYDPDWHDNPADEPECSCADMPPTADSECPIHGRLLLTVPVSFLGWTAGDAVALSMAMAELDLIDPTLRRGGPDD